MKQIVILLSYLLLFTLVSCADSTPKKQARTQVFRYNQASALHSLDPAFAKDQASIWVARQLFNTLVEVDENLNIQPSIAKKWEFSNDGKRITFHLRDDVYFVNENGQQENLTSIDVAYSLQRLIDPKVASPGAWVFNGRVADYNPFVAKSDYVFELNLKAPFQPIMGILSMQYCSIVSKKSVEKFGKEFRSNPVGSGPFQLKKWSEGEALFMAKNPNYWEKDAQGQNLPYLDGVKVTFNENKRTAFTDFVNGNLEFISGLDGSYKDEVLTKEGELQANFQGKIIMEKSPYLNTEYLGFNLKNPSNKVLLNEKVRKAINYGFDRSKMIRYLRNNIGKPAVHGFIPPGLPGHNNQLKGFDYNPEKAKQLLKQAGYSNTNLVPEIVLETSSSYKDLCIYIQRQLLEIGIRLRIEMVPPSFLREKMSKGESDFFRASWIGDYPDAETFLTVFYGGNPAPPNYTRFKNQNFDKLYNLALIETDDEKRHAFYRDMDKEIINNAPIIPLFYDEVVRFSQPYVKGLKMNAFNWLTLKKVKLVDN